MPAAARTGDQHHCLDTEPMPHEGGPIVSGCETVFLGDELAARMGDEVWCEGEAYDVIVTGEPTVLIGGRPAARLGDATDGGLLVTGFTTVQIGPHPLIRALRYAADRGLPFCERPVRARPSKAQPR